MTTNLALPTESQPLIGKPFDVWTGQGHDIFSRLRDTEQAYEQSQWEIGEWLVAGLDEFEFDEKASYKTAKEITGWEYGTLRNVVWIVRRFPNLSLRSDTVLKWSHFKELAPIKSEQERLKLLNRLDDGFDRTVEQVREFVDKVLDRERKPAAKQHAAAKGFYLQTSSLNHEQKNIFKALAKKRGKNPKDLLRTIVLEFIAEHKGEIQIKSAARKR
jgi:hypothetical protein